MKHKHKNLKTLAECKQATGSSAEHHPSRSASPPQRREWGWLELGEEKRDDQKQKVREFNRLKHCFRQRRKPRQTHGTTDNIWWSGWRTQPLYTREGRKRRGTGEAEQMEETRPIRKVREPMNTPDRHEWKWQENPPYRVRSSKILKLRTNKQLKEEHHTAERGLTGKITTEAFGASYNSTFLWFPPILFIFQLRIIYLMCQPASFIVHLISKIVFKWIILSREKQANVAWNKLWWSAFQ